MSQDDSGREFEIRALDLARSLHDPLNHQGSQMVDGREHDGIFYTPDAVIAYEFTVERSKDKARKDGTKLAYILKKESNRPENRYLALSGYFVTRDEPTADQREAISRIASAEKLQIYAISYASLMKRLIDVEMYIRQRDAAPFGSTEMRITGKPETQTSQYVKQHLVNDLGDRSGQSTQELAERCAAGERTVLLGDFGAGKSSALLQCYRSLRKSYFKNTDQRRVPFHINLREMMGVRSPSELLRRHADEIGFSRPDQLISAWRAGNVDLILDGFDELLPTRWTGEPVTSAPSERERSIASLNLLLKLPPLRELSLPVEPSTLLHLKSSLKAFA